MQLSENVVATVVRGAGVPVTALRRGTDAEVGPGASRT